MEKINLKFVELNKENVKIAGKIQFNIFGNYSMCGYADYLKEINIKDRLKKRILPLNYIVYHENNPIGLIGLYEIDRMSDDIFVNWFCVCPEYRMQGYGTQMFYEIIEIAKLYNKKYLRLFTFSNLHKAVMKIYKNIMQLEEDYNNKKDMEFIKKFNLQCKVFSLSLCSETVIEWNNRYIGLLEEYELNKRSIELLIKDKIITEEDIKNIAI